MQYLDNIEILVKTIFGQYLDNVWTIFGHYFDNICDIFAVY